jgi:hypothetical protein
MPQIQTSIKKEDLAKLHYMARMSGMTLREYVRNLIFTHLTNFNITLEEDTTCQKKTEQTKSQNAPGNF